VERKKNYNIIASTITLVKESLWRKPKQL
jgi:hypothetical protein